MTKLNITSKISTIVCFLLFVATVNGQQIDMPQASPAASISQKIGLTDVKIEYSRPSTKGRKIFGELVPYGQVWRAGANAATVIDFSTPVKIEGNKVPAGSYAIYAIPDRNEWTFILSKNTKLWGAVGYSQEDDFLRFKVKTAKTGQKYETMEIGFTDMTDTGANIVFKWESVKAGFRIETEVDEIVMAQIKKLVIDQEPTNPGLYYQAANYYFTNKKDMSKALEWINKSVESDPKYWTAHLKAKIELELGKKKEALETAKMSMEMAKEAKNPDYVGLNERLIKSIK
ncbi:DUF2911 domain-containing protein [Belliella kenyensis]|uniref:DUF2911 domain-containing protein n=1 Tax=Belliella kenyensis TaxID=1472724 RepID=A0ABV8EGS4_9BACT|nr:DUF2911 domain-containing protein [Belliella kenyensis]MCH7401925.1 DUF2911 domain-containing protein [Belliella kenyensis]MDN3604425.1 DUF2911 domain-containing protein [Belliella kenyensis]